MCLLLFCHADKTIKLWKISERDKRPEGYNLKEEDGRYRDPNTVTTLRVRVCLHGGDALSSHSHSHCLPFYYSADALVQSGLQ